MFELIEEINSVLVFYTCPSSPSICCGDDFYTIMDDALSSRSSRSHGPDEDDVVLWKWVIDAKGFGIKHAGEIRLALRIIKLIHAKYIQGLTQIEIVNPTWQMHSLLCVIQPFLDKSIMEMIQVRPDPVDYENRFTPMNICTIEGHTNL
jgi:hypothetical protein